MQTIQKDAPSNQTVSVIMGLYNCEDTLPQAFASLAAQTYQDIEIIVCDDASSDGTAAVAEAFAARWPGRLLLLRNDQNLGLSASLNRCLAHATGTYVARMDGDDRCLPERFAVQVAYLRAHPEVDLVGSAMQRFDDGGLKDIVRLAPCPDRLSMRKAHVVFFHATIMTYKRVYDALDGYTVSERTRRSQDYDLWFRFFHAGFTGVNLDEPLYQVREDASAIRRRTRRVRWNRLQTTRIGFRLLGFPRWWIIRPFAETVVKCLIPYGLMDLYRKFQVR